MSLFQPSYLSLKMSPRSKTLKKKKCDCHANTFDDSSAH